MIDAFYISMPVTKEYFDSLSPTDQKILDMYFIVFRQQVVRASVEAELKLEQNQKKLTKRKTKKSTKE
jgi:hypothetical protein